MLESLGGGPTSPPGRTEDPKVAAVMEVLAGTSVVQVSRRWHVDPMLLRRWVQSFVEAGTAQVLNRPAGDTAAQRDRFLAAFAHETRSPLTIALGWIDMLRDEDLDPAISEGMQRVEDSLHRLRDRSFDVELLAAAALGRLPLDPQRTTITELTQDLASPRVETDDASTVGALIVDATTFTRLLRDLWSAAHTAPAPRHVHLRVTREGPWTEVAVIRNADPIDPTVLQAMLEPFQSNDDNTGVTIGLYLARALAIAHGGTIGVDQDQATCRFWVRIPAA